MVEINVTGQSPGGGQPAGSFQGSTAQRAQGFEAAQKANQRSQAAVEQAWERATKQQAQQRSQEAQAAARVARDNATIQRRQAAADAALLRATEREVQLRNAQVERMRRDNASLNRAYGNLQSRAGADITPAMHRNLSRQQQVLRERAADYRRRYGANASIPDIDALSLGSVRGAYGVQQARRLGVRGASALTGGSYMEAGRIEAELGRIEKTVEAQLAFWRSPAQRANVQRQENKMLVSDLIRQQTAIGRAREQMGAARSGLSGSQRLLASAGGMAGELFGTLGLGALGVAGGAAAAAIAQPYLLNQSVSWILGLGQKYRDYSIAAKQSGRAGGYAAKDFVGQFYNEGLTGYIPGFQLTGRAMGLGLGPGDIAANLGSYGVASRSAGEAGNIVERIRRGYLGTTGLSEQAIGQYLGQGRALGGISGSPMAGDTNRYWTQLERVMATATGQGLDRSSAIRTMTGLMATGGLTQNVGGMADWFGRLTASGTPSMRSGAGILSLTSDIAQSSRALGTSGNIAGNITLGTLAQRVGGMPKTEDGLRRFLGVDKDSWNRDWVSTPASQAALQGYLSAVQSGDGTGAMQYFGQLTANHPQEMATLVQKLTSGMGPNLGPRATGAALGTSLENALVLSSTRSGQGSGLPGWDTRSVAQNLMQRNMRDLGLSPEQAAGVVGGLQGEGFTTGFERNPPKGSRGGVGIAQWTGSRRDAFFAWAKNQGLDPMAYETQQRYFEYDLQNNYPQVLDQIKNAKTPAEANAAFFNGYLAGGDRGLIAAHGAERQRMTQQVMSDYGSNNPLPELQRGAQQQASGLKASEYADTGAAAAFSTITYAAEGASLALDGFTAALGRATKIFGNIGGSTLGGVSADPMTGYIPSSSQPLTQSAPVR